MSNLKVNTINDANGGSAAVLYGVASPPNSMGFRNRIINGDMRIDQRNAGASVTVNAGGTVYTLDRWAAVRSTAGSYAVQQSAIVPSGFTSSLGITNNTAGTPAAGEFNFIFQRIEGFNVSDLGWGTASAQAITLSFQVRASASGTYGGSLRNSAGNRSYPFTFTVTSANTFESKSITVAGDTTGTWLTTNSTGIEVDFDLGSGATFRGTAGAWASGNFVGATGASQNMVLTSGATFYITGVQLEAGTVATPFERRDYGRELLMCQRYYQWSGFGYGFALNTGLVSMNFPLIVQMRANPSATYWNGANALVRMGGGGESYSSITPYVVRPTFVGTNVFGSGYTTAASYAALESNAIAISAEL